MSFKLEPYIEYLKDREKKLRYDRLYLDIALRVAQMSHAVRAKVGCIAVKDGNIISIGWNGMPSGMDNCCEHLELTKIDENHSEFLSVTNPEVSHAEENMLGKLARGTTSSVDATVYTTLEPCLPCAKMLHTAGIIRVVYGDHYRTHDGIIYLQERGIEVEFLL